MFVHVSLLQTFKTQVLSKSVPCVFEFCTVSQPVATVMSLWGLLALFDRIVWICMERYKNVIDKCVRY